MALFWGAATLFLKKNAAERPGIYFAQTYRRILKSIYFCSLKYFEALVLPVLSSILKVLNLENPFHTGKYPNTESASKYQSEQFGRGRIW